MRRSRFADMPIFAVKFLELRVRITAFLASSNCGSFGRNKSFESLASSVFFSLMTILRFLRGGCDSPYESRVLRLRLSGVSGSDGRFAVFVAVFFSVFLVFFAVFSAFFAIFSRSTDYSMISTDSYLLFFVCRLQ